MRLHEYLNNEGMTSAAFATLVGVHPSQISRVRRGQSRPSWELVSKIADATNGAVTANDFMQTETAA